MAKDKEKSVNPAQQQRKLEKAKQLKKSRADLQARRNEKLARRNPERIQRQIDDIKALEAAGDIKPRERAILEELERDLKAVKKAREALGEKAVPNYTQRRRDGDGNKDDSLLGKRRYNGERKPYSHHKRDHSSGSDTDDSVRRIPMPEDTPPPIPREFRRYFPRNNQNVENEGTQEPNTTLPPKPISSAPPVTKTTYESAPQIRDLHKEAVNRFVPDVVRRKQEAVKGTGPAGRLIEPEEMDRLEAEGYVVGGGTDRERRTPQTAAAKAETMDGSIETREDELARLAAEEARFLRDLEMQDAGENEDDRAENHPAATIPTARGTETQISSSRARHHVQIEDVEDEDA